MTEDKSARIMDLETENAQLRVNLAAQEAIVACKEARIENLKQWLAAEHETASKHLERILERDSEIATLKATLTSIYRIVASGDWKRPTQVERAVAERIAELRQRLDKAETAIAQADAVLRWALNNKENPFLWQALQDGLDVTAAWMAENEEIA